MRQKLKIVARYVYTYVYRSGGGEAPPRRLELPGRVELEEGYIYLRYFFSKYTYILQKSKFTANNDQKTPCRRGGKLCFWPLFAVNLHFGKKYVYVP